MIYFLLAIPILMFVVFFGALGIAAIYDLWYRYKYRTYFALKKDHNAPRRPTAK